MYTRHSEQCLECSKPPGDCCCDIIAALASVTSRDLQGFQMFHLRRKQKLLDSLSLPLSLLPIPLCLFIVSPE